MRGLASERLEFVFGVLAGDAVESDAAAGQQSGDLKSSPGRSHAGHQLGAKSNAHAGPRPNIARRRTVRFSSALNHYRPHRAECSCDKRQRADPTLCSFLHVPDIARRADLPCAPSPPTFKNKTARKSLARTIFRAAHRAFHLISAPSMLPLRSAKRL